MSAPNNESVPVPLSISPMTNEVLARLLEVTARLRTNVESGALYLLEDLDLGF